MTQRGQRPTELRNFIPEPDLILYGCRPLVPFIPGWHDRQSDDQHFHAPKDVIEKRKQADPNWPKNRWCPGCHGQIGHPRENLHGKPSVPDLDHRTYCERCGSMDAANEARAAIQRGGEKAAERARDNDRQVEREERLTHDAIRKGGVVLSEVQRRHLWNGYRGGILKAYDKVTNRAKYGREFLSRIGQEPNWSLALDKRGNVVKDKKPKEVGTEPT